MIISVSRRSDIPCHYFEWFLQCLEKQEVTVHNPFNPQQTKKISLTKDDCFVFWSKNPKGLLQHYEKIKDYPFYVQFTITPYHKDIEPNLDKKEAIANFIKLSQLIGKHRVIFRYNPILLNDTYTVEYHKVAFKKLIDLLGEYTEQVIISFLDHYRNTPTSLKRPNSEQAKELVTYFKSVFANIKACAEDIDIEKAHCIDLELVERITKTILDIPRDRNQRPNCGCVQSVDIGTYNTCKTGCIYCYAMKKIL